MDGGGHEVAILMRFSRRKRSGPDLVNRYLKFVPGKLGDQVLTISKDTRSADCDF